MSYTIEIKGVDKTSLVKAQSLRITKGADNRSDCSLSLITTASAIGTTDGMIIGQDFKVKDGSTVIFGGIIKTIRVVKLASGTGNTKQIQLDITSDGYNDIPSRRTTTEYYTNKYAGDIVWEVMNILNTTGASEGLSEGTIDDGAFLSVYSAICKSAKEIFDELAEASGYKWYIDDLKFLHFVQDDTVAAAAHDLVETAPTFTDFDVIDVDISLENYRNKQFVRGTKEENGAIIYIGVDDITEIAARQTAEDAAYSSGVYGDVIDSTNIWSVDDATITANNALKRYGAIPYTISFTSMTNDWVAGSKLKVNLPSYGIGSDTYFLIESVNIVDVGGVFMSEVTATRRKESDFSTQRTENYKDYFAKLIKAAKEGYTDGGGSADSGGIFVVHGTNEAAFSVVSASETEAATVDIAFDRRSKAVIHFSCEVAISTGAANLTAKIYVDGVALTYQPTHYCATTNTFTFSFHAYKGGVASGTKTINVKLQTDANTGAVSIGHALLTVHVLPDPMVPTLNPTGFTATANGSSQIDLAWTNPTADYFTEVEVYRSTSDLSARDREWCDANATLVYNGAATSDSDTGLTTETTYYYKIFAEYTIEGSAEYSSGVEHYATTGVSLYQSWSGGLPDSPLLTEDYPNQAISFYNGTTYFLWLTTSPFFEYDTSKFVSASTTKMYMLSSGNWSHIQDVTNYINLGNLADVVQANEDIFENDTYAVVVFAKTT